MDRGAAWGIALGIALGLASCGPSPPEPEGDSGEPEFSCGDPHECDASLDCPVEAPFCVFDDNDPSGCCMAAACGEGGWEDLCHCRKVCIAACLDPSHTGHSCRDDASCCGGMRCSDADEVHGGVCVQ